MMRLIARAAIAAAAAIAVAGFATLRAGYAETIDSVVAAVDGTPITSYDLKSTAASPGAGSALGAAQPGIAVPASDDPQEKLEALILQQMLDHESLKYLEKLDEAQVDRYIQTVEERNHLTEEQLRGQLKAQGISYDSFRANIRKQVAAMEMFDREVRQRVIVPDSAIEAYYKAHQDEFTTSEEKYRLAQILIAVAAGATPEQTAAAKKKAEEIRKEAEKGADFGELARQYSEDDSKTKGGELGEFAPSELNNEIAAGVAKLKAGDISEVVHTKYGFHIVKVEEHVEPGTRPLAAVRGEIRDKLASELAKTEFQKWINDKLRQQHSVETPDQHAGAAP
jgi:peptidyl-prolyl cis-trans isomerase SurA